MITQILGVALISLLTITPTIQQNNIQQLNINTINGFNNPSPQRIYELDNYSYYFNPGGFNTIITTINENYIFINYDNLLDDSGTSIQTFNTNSTDELIVINNNNFYIYDQSNSNRENDANITHNGMRELINKYYIKKYNTPVTSQTFSWSFNSVQELLATVDFYTYSVSGNAGTISGRVYVRNTATFGQTTLGITNNNVTLNNPTVQQLVQAVNPTINQLELSTSADHKIWYYFTSSDLATTNGTYTTTLRARTNYGRVLNLGTITYTVALDTTPPVITGPTSITFEVGTYSLVEQILNDLYTFTDNVAIDDAYYFPVTSINTVGTFNITVYATDTAGNQTNLPVTITTTPPPPSDTTPPVIIGSDTITRELGQINNDAQLANVFNITDDFTQPSAIVKTITGNRSYTQAGTYNLTLTAIDQAGNDSTKQFTFIINEPVIDNEPPVIVSDLIVSITIGDFTDRQEILDFYTTVTDNIALNSVLLVGDINFNEIGDYQLQIIATDTSENQAIRNILVRIKDEVILGNYNPLTDLLSGIFGGALSMIFTIGTINVLGLRLLDAMGVIILGAVLLFVYKAIKGGS
jgi:hypothetical protein